MAVAGQRLQRATVNRTQGGPPRTARPLTLDAARASWRALPRGTQRTHSTPSSVTTVSSTGIFLAPRSARRSDASNAAGWTAGGSLWRQRQPGRKWRARVQTPAAHAQPGWHRRLAARSARRSDASDAAGQSAGESLRRQRQTGRLRRARSNAAWQWSSAKEPAADARTRARCRARTIVRGRDAPALPRHTACGAHLGPRPPKQPVWRVRTPPRMGERAPSRRALDHPHQPAARPECPSARPASRPPRHALDQRPAYGRESPARSHGNPMTRAQR